MNHNSCIGRNTNHGLLFVSVIGTIFPSLFQMVATTEPSLYLGIGDPGSNVSITIADHLLVSREAQAIIGGVVGFWGGVFGMGSVYLLVVCLRRLRKQLQNQRNNGPIILAEKVSWKQMCILKTQCCQFCLTFITNHFQKWR